MAGDFGIVYPLWDYVVDDGAFLERVAGEVGIDHVTIPVVTGEITQIRTRLLPESPYFHTEGGWHYPVDTKHYAGISVRPKTAKWFGGKNVLARARDRAEDLGLTVYFRLDIPYAAAVIPNSSHLKQRNAWGDEYASAPACICNPEVRELTRLTMDELLRYAPAGFQFDHALIDLSSVGMRDTYSVGGFRVSELFDMCFCPTCRQVGGQGDDAEHAARSIRTHLERISRLADMESRGPFELWGRDEQVDADELLNQYRSARENATREWLDVRATAASGIRLFHMRHLSVHLLSDFFASPQRRGGNSTPLNCIPLLNAPYAFGAANKQRLDAAVAELQPRAARELGLSGLISAAFLHDPTAAAEFVQHTVDWSERGVTFFDFEGLFQSPPEVVTWLRQAVRYARRG